MSSSFKGDELNYHDVDEKLVVLFREVKHFQPYLLKSRTKLVVPYPVVRNLFVQKDLGDKRATWMKSLQEYNIEIKPSSVVRGKGICKLVDESTYLPVNNSNFYIDESFLKKEIYLFLRPQYSWYSDMRIILETGSDPDNLDPKKRRDLILKLVLIS